MSGWIKFEKDLLTDPRTFRLAQKLAAKWEVALTGAVSSRNAHPLPGVTVVLGGLVTLWSLADTHISEDDILPLGVDEINQLIGLKGFCEQLPADWLQVIDANSVKLPGYHEHNGTIAKERAQGAKRQARFRQGVTIGRDGTRNKSNGRALPDQDQTKTRPEKEALARATPGLHLDSWEAWIDYRKSSGKPLKPASMVEAAKKLAAFGKYQGAVVTQSVANGWQGLFALKDVPHGPSGRPSNVPDEREVQDLQERARKIGFRDRGPTESLGGYRTLLEREELALRNRGGAPVRAVPTLVRQ